MAAYELDPRTIDYQKKNTTTNSKRRARFEEDELDLREAAVVRVLDVTARGPIPAVSPAKQRPPLPHSLPDAREDAAGLSHEPYRQVLHQRHLPHAKREDIAVVRALYSATHSGPCRAVAGARTLPHRMTKPRRNQIGSSANLALEKYVSGRYLHRRHRPGSGPVRGALASGPRRKEMKRQPIRMANPPATTLPAR